MAYDEALADEVRAHIATHPGLSERQMFGGIAFLVNGNMAVGVNGDDLIVRVAAEQHDELVILPGARVFDLTGKPMRGWLAVGPAGTKTPADRQAWVERGVDHAETLPPK